MSNDAKSAFGSKTIIVGIIMGVLAMVNYFQEVVTDPKTLSLLGVIASGIVIILRFLTGKPVNLKLPGIDMHCFLPALVAASAFSLAPQARTQEPNALLGGELVWDTVNQKALFGNSTDMANLLTFNVRGLEYPISLDLRGCVATDPRSWNQLWVGSGIYASTVFQRVRPFVGVGIAVQLAEIQGAENDVLWFISAGFHVKL